MSDIQKQARDTILRSIGHEFARMEDDFDDTRVKRDLIINKLFTEVDKIKLSDENGNLIEDADTGLKIYTTALKALADVEKANTQAISLKLKQQENQIASAAAAKDRIAIVLKATAPGRIEENDFPSEQLESTLHEMFNDDIKDFELKSNNNDLEE